MSTDNIRLNPSLIGSVLERKPSSPKPPSQSRFSGAINSKTGFPLAQHRSQKSSAFLKGREDGRRKPDERLDQVPPVISTPGLGPRTMQNGIQNATDTAEDWRQQISTENEARVQAMTEEEREAEIREILDKFGPSVGEILRRARDKREGKKEGNSIGIDEGLSTRVILVSFKI